MTLDTKKFPPQKKPLLDAIKIFSNVNNFSKHMGVTRQAVYGWLYNSQLAPPSRFCKKIEEITKGEITCEKLRPDVYGEIGRHQPTDQEKLETCLILLSSIAQNIDKKKRDK